MIVLACPRCSREFKTWPSWVRRGVQFCSKACSAVAKRPMRRCPACGQWFSAPASAQVCSKDCAAELRQRRRIARFFAKVDACGPNGCWVWRAFINPQTGYGQFGRFAAHRWSWAYHNGPVPAGLCVCHHCDNKRCVNPAHLFVGTHKDNTQDAIQKGRFYQHRLLAQLQRARRFDQESIAALRRSGLTPKEIETRIGCGSTTVYLALRANGLTRLAQQRSTSVEAR